MLPGTDGIRSAAEADMLKPAAPKVATNSMDEPGPKVTAEAVLYRAPFTLSSPPETVDVLPFTGSLPIPKQAVTW